MAFPKDNFYSKETNDTDAAIKRLIGTDKVYIYVSPYQGVAFRTAPMTQDQQDQIQAIPGVSELYGISIFLLLICFRSVDVGWGYHEGQFYRGSSFAFRRGWECRWALC